MKARYTPMTATLVAVLAGLCPRGVLAAERACPVMTIEPDAAFRARFSDLLERARNHFTASADVDACARVELRLEGDSTISVWVTLPDGRAASRGVTRREDVIPTLQALLLVPHESASAAPSASPARAAPRRRALIHATSHAEVALAPRAPDARQLGVELSVITGARVGDGQLGLGAGALSFLELKGFLIGFEGRADAYRPITGGDPETALELAILAGRRVDFGSVALDLTVGPAVAMKGLALSQTEVRSEGATIPQTPPPPQSDPSSGPVPRLLLGARLGFRARSVLRTFVGIDGEVGTARAASNQDAFSGRLPGYTVGIALGATVGTP